MCNEPQRPIPVSVGHLSVIQLQRSQPNSSFKDFMHKIGHGHADSAFVLEDGRAAARGGGRGRRGTIHVYLSTYLSTYLPIRLSTYLSIYTASQDRITYNAAISACEKSQEWRQALTLLRQAEWQSLPTESGMLVAPCVALVYAL